MTTLTKPSNLIFISLIGWLIGGYTLFVAGDLYNLFGLSDLLQGAGARGLWSSYFGTRGPTELFQWISQMSVMAVSWILWRKGKGNFWFWLSFFSFLLFIEDRFDFRDSVLESVVGVSRYTSFIFLGILASVIGIKYRKVIIKHPWIIIGSFVYGLSAIYDAQIIVTAAQMGNLVDVGDIVANNRHVVHSALGEALFEEGSELLAIGLILVGTLKAWEQKEVL